MGDEQGSPKYPVPLLTFLVIEINLMPYIVLSLFSDEMANLPPKNHINMGKVVGEGYKRGGVVYGQQTHAVVILNKAAEPITSYTEFVN